VHLLLQLIVADGQPVVQEDGVVHLLLHTLTPSYKYTKLH
jgi:hypothetical protein